MAVWSTTSYKRLLIDNRIDAEYYKKDIEKLVLFIEKNSFEFLNKYIEILTDGKHGGVNYTNEGVLFIRNQNVKNGIILLDEKKFISENESSQSVRAELNEGDIVLTTIGTIGESAIINKYIPKSTINQNLVKIRVKNINPYFLSVFFLTKYGKNQIIRLASGNVQPIIVYPNLKKIRIPNIVNEKQEKIADNYKKSIDKLEQSKDLYNQATKLLEQELGLDKIKFEKKKSFTANFSEIVENNRIDGDFHNPNLKSFYKQISNKFELKKITNFADVLKFSNPDYSKDGIPIITQRHLSDISPENYGDTIASNLWVNKNSNAILKENDLLYYSVGAYLGKTNLWYNAEKAVPASFITLLRCKNIIDSEFLMIMLNSAFGILQSKVYQSGTSQQYIYPKDIRRFLIADINTELKLKISELVKGSFEAKKQSKLLLEQAKKRVEELIEENAFNEGGQE